MRNHRANLIGFVLSIGIACFLLCACVQSKSSTPSPLVDTTTVPPGPGILPASALRQYVLTHEYIGGPTVSGKPPTILMLRLMTNKQAITLRGGAHGVLGSDDLPGSAPVYYFKLRGPFLMTNLPVVKTPTVDTVEEVFDAKTGNFIF